jgi:hypothetical protein
MYRLVSEIQKHWHRCIASVVHRSMGSVFRSMGSDNVLRFRREEHRRIFRAVAHGFAVAVKVACRHWLAAIFALEAAVFEWPGPALGLNLPVVSGACVETKEAVEAALSRGVTPSSEAEVPLWRLQMKDVGIVACGS